MTGGLKRTAHANSVPGLTLPQDDVDVDVDAVDVDDDKVD
jgi:hypothetical protein